MNLMNPKWNPVLHCFLWRVGSNSDWNCHWLLKKYFDSDDISICLRDVSIVFSEWCIAQLARIPAPSWEASKRRASWFHSRIRNLGIEISSMGHRTSLYTLVAVQPINSPTNLPAVELARASLCHYHTCSNHCHTFSSRLWSGLACVGLIDLKGYDYDGLFLP